MVLTARQKGFKSASMDFLRRHSGGADKEEWDDLDEPTFRIKF